MLTIVTQLDIPSVQQLRHKYTRIKESLWKGANAEYNNSVGGAASPPDSDPASSLLQPAEQLRRVIGDDDVSTCAAEQG